jgi:hypothetical protein
MDRGKEEETIFFGNNAFFVGFTRDYEIEQVLQILASISNGEYITLNGPLTVYFAVSESDVKNYTLYKDQLKDIAFVFDFKLGNFLEYLETIDKNTFCILFGHGPFVIQELKQTSQIEFGGEDITSHNISEAFKKNSKKNEIYILFRYFSCFNFSMFTGKNVPEHILSVQDKTCHPNTGTLSSMEFGQKYLFIEHVGFHQITTKEDVSVAVSHGFDKNTILSFTLCWNPPEYKSEEEDDYDVKYEDEYDENFGGKRKSRKAKKAKKAKKSKKSKKAKKARKTKKAKR